MAELENQNIIPQQQTSSSQKKSRLSLILVVAVLLLISFFGGMVVGLNRRINAADTSDTAIKSDAKILNSASVPEYLNKDVNFNIFWQVWDIIKNKYVDRDKVNDPTLFYGALQGAVASLKDPYSVFMTPENSKEFSDELQGKFEGIGAEIGMRDNLVTIVAPLDDSPAQKAGLKALDKIITINDADATNYTLDEAVKQIRGPKGTQVNLSILRGTEKEPRKFTITRDTIKIVSVKLEDKNGVAYLKVSNFNTDTSGAFEAAANELLKTNPKAIILDLRNNPGGYLDTAVSMAGYWVKSGSVVVKEKFNDNTQNQDYSSNGSAPFKDIKTIVLVNGGSASASEIVSGALQDYGLATIVGEQTFGKGSVQELEKLSDGSSIKITIAKWLTPNGRTIDKNGITPDVKVELTEKDYNDGADPQMDKAMELINTPTTK